MSSHYKTRNYLVESSVHSLDTNKKLTEVINTELLAASHQQPFALMW